METIKIRYRRSLKRKNFSAHTIKNYMHRINMFALWLRVPLEKTTRREIGVYVDHLLQKRLSPKTITCHLQTIRLFFDYLADEEGMAVENPVRRISIRLPKPLPRHLKDGQAEKFLAVIKDPRDRAMFLLMLRCGLRVSNSLSQFIARNERPLRGHSRFFFAMGRKNSLRSL
jgi:site-specific recombinase XerD